MSDKWLLVGGAPDSQNLALSVLSKGEVGEDGGQRCFTSRKYYLKQSQARAEAKFLCSMTIASRLRSTRFMQVWMKVTMLSLNSLMCSSSFGQ